MWLPSDTLQHSRGPWKRHKYTAIKNGRYIYPGESVEGAARNYRQAAKAADAAQEAGKMRTARESLRKQRRALKTAHREQEKGKNRTTAVYDQAVKKQIKAIKELKAERKRNAMKQRIRNKGRRAAAIEDNSKTIARQITKNGIVQRPFDSDIKNKTYKKNQRRAKLESLIFKGKRKVKKLLNSLTTRKPKKYTIKGVNFVEDKSRKPTPVRKASKSAGETIYKAYQDQKKKKRR